MSNSAQTVADIGESGVLRLIAPFLSPASLRLLVPPGDDCAVAAVRGNLQVLTTDLLVEGNHFLSGPATDWLLLGRKAVAVNLSDIAAMGALPDSILVSVGLPPHLTAASLEMIYRGMSFEAGLADTLLTGGDTVRANQFVINLAVVGHKSTDDGTCLRSNCRPGHNVYVSGFLGGSRAGLDMVLGKSCSRSECDALELDSFRLRHLTPEPRIALGRMLATEFPDSAVIDVSDGLHNELGLLCRASGTAIKVTMNDIPLFPALEKYCGDQRAAAEFALFSGEEYELLFTTAATEEQITSALLRLDIPTAVTKIGTVEQGDKLLIVDGRGEPVPFTDVTYRHFNPS